MIKKKRILRAMIFIILLVLTFSFVYSNPLDILKINYGIIEKDELFGKVTFKEDILSFKNQQTLLSNIKISNGKIEIDSNQYPELNKEAEICFYGKEYDKPILFRNGLLTDVKVKKKNIYEYCAEVKGFSYWEISDTTFTGTHNNSQVYSGGLGNDPDIIYGTTFNENKSLVYDTSVYGNYIDTRAPSHETNCKYGNSCLYFNETPFADYFSFDNSPTDLNFTWCFWVDLDYPSAGNDRIIYDISAGTGSYTMISSGSYFYTVVYNTSGIATIANNNAIGIQTGFHHLCYNYNYITKNMTQYYDGNKHGEKIVGDYDPPLSTVSLTFSQPTTHPYNGIIQCVQYWDKTLNLAEIQSVNNSLTCDETLVNPTHTWKLDNYTKNITDSVGTFDTDAGPFYIKDGNISGAFEFDGKNDYYDTDIHNNYTTISISAWAKADNLNSASYRYIVGKGELNANEPYALMADQEGIVTKYRCQMTTNLEYHLLTYEGNYNEWYHLACVKNATDVLLYVNGVLEANEDLPGDLLPTTDSITVGAEYTPASRYFDGLIDEIKIFNRTITPEEVLELYNNSKQFIVQENAEYTSQAYNYSDYDPEIEQNIWLFANSSNTENINTFYARTDTDCLSGWGDWVLGTQTSNTWSLGTSLTGKCFQYKLILESDTNNNSQIESINITSHKIKLPYMNEFGINVSDDNITTGDTISCEGLFMLNDTDNGTINYSWYINDVYSGSFAGISVTNNTFINTSLTSGFSYGDNVSCIAYPIIYTVYGNVSGSTNQSDYIINNSDFTYTYWPTEIYLTVPKNDVIPYTITLTDPDDDVITTWYVDGVYVITGTTYNFDTYDTYFGINNTITAAMSDGEFARNQTWYLTTEGDSMDKGIISIIIFLPIILSIIFLIGAATLNGEKHPALKIFLFILSIVPFFVSMHLAMVSMVKFYDFQALEEIIGTTTYWVGIIFGLIITYFIIYLIHIGFKQAAQRKTERLEY